MRTISKDLADKLRPAAAVFAERGYDAATIEVLSEATGVPTSTLYYNFDGKQELLAFLLQDWLDRTSVLVATAIGDPPQPRSAWRRSSERSWPRWPTIR